MIAKYWLCAGAALASFGVGLSLHAATINIADMSINSSSVMDAHTGPLSDLSVNRFAILDSIFYNYQQSEGSNEYTKYEDEEPKRSGGNPFNLSELDFGDPDGMAVLFLRRDDYIAVIFDPPVQDFTWRLPADSDPVESYALTGVSRVPEPASVSLLALGTAALLRRRRS